MKKQPKLRLGAETLRRLDSLEGVAGGALVTMWCQTRTFHCNPPTETCPTIICTQ